jgi:hypothetical protein
MDTKQELVSHIRNWIQIDNEISDMQKKIKLCREKRKN